MGSKPKYRPQRLARKLLQIRTTFGLSQSDMLRRLGAAHSLSPGRISEYESGARVPSLWMLLAYARDARVHLENLIDDETTLPNTLPGRFIFDRYKQRNGTAQPHKLRAIRKFLKLVEPDMATKL